MGRLATWVMLGGALAVLVGSLATADPPKREPGTPSAKGVSPKPRPRPRSANDSARGDAARAQPGVTVQLPSFGVAIDAEGFLQLEQHADDGQLRAQRLAAARQALPGKVAAWSDVRKVSLRQLERSLRDAIAVGRRPDDAQLHLAGLQRVRYVFYLPESKDIVLAGPAEGWLADPAGRAVGLSTGRPTLLLEDLIAALRAYAPGGPDRPVVGCSIDPAQQSLARLVEFQKQVPRSVPEAQREAVAERTAEGVRAALGRADIRVFGISPGTHMAQVFVEADYRMKRIGIGAEEPPLRMTTFAAALSGAQQGALQRWWFVPDYEGVKVTDDHRALELVGQGVKLLGEDKLIAADGRLAGTRAAPSKASELFTTAFTRNYEKIAARVAVYAQMRAAVDLLIAAAFVRHEDFYRQADWPLGVFADEKALPIETLPAPRQVVCVVNCFWKGNRLYTPAGGGVTIRADDALGKEHLLPDKNGQLRAAYERLERPAAESWWWD